MSNPDVLEMLRFQSDNPVTASGRFRAFKTTERAKTYRWGVYARYLAQFVKLPEPPEQQQPQQDKPTSD